MGSFKKANKMQTTLEIWNLDKKERTYKVRSVGSQTQIFTIKGVGKNFILFNNDQQLNSFKTLTACYDFIKSIA